MIIHANNPLNQNKIDYFERKHHLHTLITVNREEIRINIRLSKIMVQMVLPKKILILRINFRKI